MRPALFLVLRFILILPAFFLGATGVRAQYQGPASGSIAGGATVSTGNFPLIPAAGAERSDQAQRAIPWFDIKPLNDPKHLIAPTAPAGSNEVYDKSVAPPQLEAPIRLAGFPGIPDLGTVIPPDPHMAAGPNHLMATVNRQFGISTRPARCSS